MLEMPAGREASQDGGLVEHERHRPERTLFYQLVEKTYPAFEAQWAAEGKVLPDTVRPCPIIVSNKVAYRLCLRARPESHVHILITRNHLLLGLPTLASTVPPRS